MCSYIGNKLCSSISKNIFRPVGGVAVKLSLTFELLSRYGRMLILLTGTVVKVVNIRNIYGNWWHSAAFSGICYLGIPLTSDSAAPCYRQS